MNDDETTKEIIKEEIPVSENLKLKNIFDRYFA